MLNCHRFPKTGRAFANGELVSLGGKHPVKIVDVPTALVKDEYTIQVGEYFGTDDYAQQVLIPITLVIGNAPSPTRRWRSNRRSTEVTDDPSVRDPTAAAREFLAALILDLYPHVLDIGRKSNIPN